MGNIVSINSENQDLKQVLEAIFQGTLVKYYEIETQILLKKEDEFQANATVGDSSFASTQSKVLKAFDSNARYMVLENGKYKRKFTLGNLFRLQFNTFKRKGFGSELPELQLETIDSLDLLMKDSSLTSKVKRKIIKHRRTIRNAAKPFYRFAVGAFAAPEITYRSLKGGEAQYVSERNLFEDWIWNYSTGISLDYYITKHWFVRSGISYLNFGEKGRYRAAKPYLLPNQTANTDTTISYSNNMNCFGVPLLVGFKTGGRLSFALNTGIIIGFSPQPQTSYPEEKNETYSYTSQYIVNPNFSHPTSGPNPFEKAPNQNPYFQQRPNQMPPPQGQFFPPTQSMPEVYSITTTAYYYRDYLDPKKHSLSQISYIYSLGADLGYDLSKKFRVIVSPFFKYFLISKYASSDAMNEKPYSFGVNVGAVYLFGKRKR